MATYHITAPDGTIHEINAPDSASQAEVMAYARQQFTKSPGIGGLARAAISGVNGGMAADVLGMPVDAIANALDLGKAAIGYPYSKLTGKPPPDWTAPSDRSQQVGTSAWIAGKIRQGANALGVESPVDNPYPNDALARVLHTAGRGAGASITPMPGAAISAQRNAGSMALGTLSGMTSGIVNEAAPDQPALAGAAAMLPQLLGRGAAAGIKSAMGGEAARQAMAQRLQDFKNGGVQNPSLGLTTGSPFIMGAENLLSKVPGSVGNFQNANAANFNGMRDKIAALRDSTSQSYGRALAGNDIQSDLSTVLPRRISAGYEKLLDKAVVKVGATTPIPVDSSIKSATDMSTPLPGAENTSGIFIQPRMIKIASALAADNAGVPTTATSALLGPGGQPITTTTPGAGQGVPFGAVRDLRTRVGQEIDSPAIIGTPAEGQYKQLYGALSDDLRNGVGIADSRAGVLPGMAGSATQAWDRSNAFYAGGMDRVARVQPFANKLVPEQAYNALMSAVNGDVSTLQAVKKSITPRTRASITATMLDDMGDAKSSYQNDKGNAFSPESYLTQYDKMAPGRNELLSGFPGAPGVRAGVDDVAKVASMLRDGSKIWANPSGSGANVAASAGLGSILGNLVTNPGAAAMGVGGLVGGNYAAKKILLNPDFVNYLAQPATAAPYADQSSMQRLINALSQSQ